MTDEKFLLEAIYGSIEAILEFRQDGLMRFSRDGRTQVWFLYHLMNIGECACALPQQTRDQMEDFPWKEVAGMRLFIMPDPFGIDVDLLWRVAERDMPRMKKTVGEGLERLFPVLD